MRQTSPLSPMYVAAGRAHRMPRSASPSRLWKRIVVAVLVVFGALSIILLSASLGRGAGSMMGAQLSHLEIFVHSETGAVFRKDAGAHLDGDEEVTEIEDVMPPCIDGGVALYASSSPTDASARKCSLGVKYGGEAVVESTELLTAALMNLDRRRLFSDWIYAAEIFNTIRREEGQKEVSLECLEKSEYRTSRAI